MPYYKNCFENNIRLSFAIFSNTVTPLVAGSEARGRRALSARLPPLSADSIQSNVRFYQCILPFLPVEGVKMLINSKRFKIQVNKRVKLQSHCGGSQFGQLASPIFGCSTIAFPFCLN